MIQLIKKLPIKGKLILICMLTCILCLTLASVVVIIYSSNYMKQEQVRNMSTISLLIADRSTAALTFQDRSLAEENLSTLRIKPLVVAACVYNQDGEIFAEYRNQSDNAVKFPAGSVKSGYYFENGYLMLSERVMLEKKQIGAVFICYSLKDYYRQQFGIILLAAMLIILSSIIAFVLAWRLQLFVSGPILHLTKTAQFISRQNDYSLRADKTSDDEIGILTAAFNEMLSMIEKQKKEVDEVTLVLKNINEELENRVLLRTNELEKSNNELKIAEMTIKENEQRLKDILNHAPILVYINDLEGRYIFINKEFERLMDLSFADVFNKTDLELFPADRAMRNIAQNKKVVETKKSQIFENVSHKKDGIHYFVDILFPITDSNDNVYATSGWSLDITDRKKSEEALREAKEKAEAADHLKSAFLATMSHELRTPLNSIIGFTGILLKKIAGPLTDEQIKQLNMIKGSGQHLLALINDVLDISKIEAGELVVSFNIFDFGKTMNKVISLVTPLADKKGLEIKSYIAPDVHSLVSDERRVEQILLNIINNAIKFTEKGYVEIKCSVEADKIAARITDTGIGIAQENLDKLFKPFSQIDSGLTRSHEGTGLGLSISKKLLEKLNGSIEVKSEINVGTTFAIFLPINGIENGR